MRAMSARAGRSFALFGAQDDTLYQPSGVILSRVNGEESLPSGAARDRYGSFASLRMTLLRQPSGVILSRVDGEESPDARDERTCQEILRPLRGSG